jgi:hypothetical protein
MASRGGCGVLVGKACDGANEYQALGPLGLLRGGGQRDGCTGGVTEKGDSGQPEVIP